MIFPRGYSRVFLRAAELQGERAGDLGRQVRTQFAQFVFALLKPLVAGPSLLQLKASPGLFQLRLRGLLAAFVVKLPFLCAGPYSVNGRDQYDVV